MRPEEKPRRSRAGCMIELTIAVFVLAVLAAVAIPDFLKFQGRAKCSESKTNLGAIFTAQTAYFGEWGTYAGGPNCFALLGWKQEGSSLYNYYCGADQLPCTHQGCKTSPCVNFEFTPGMEPMTSKKGFTIYAIGNVDRDSNDCDVWSINDVKILKNDINDVAN